MLLSIRSCLTLLFITVLAGPVLATDPAQVQKAWDILEAGVKEKSFAKRHDAIHAVGLLAGDSKAVAIAENALDDHAPEVREAAATIHPRINKGT
jgi:HEAT repeat protein